MELNEEGKNIKEEGSSEKKMDNVESQEGDKGKATKGMKSKSVDEVQAQNISFNPNWLYANIFQNNIKVDYSNLYLNNSYLNQALFFPNSTIDFQLELAGEINDLKKKLKKSAEELNETKADREKKIKEFERLSAELTAKEKTNHILSRITEEGRKKVLDSQEFQGLFRNSNKCDAVVVSIDIRRSTELMLKARTPELFSKFITELSFKLSQVIMSNYGIFDKFTGDGILAFFPKFYSGEEAIIRAIKASNECHQLFKEHYNNSKNCFNVFLKDIGLGIGIDFGNVTLVNSQSELTVVGIPVVYACRFSGTKAGETLINQPAKEEIMKLCPTMASFVESEISIKNEGIGVGYNVSLNEEAFKIPKPNWDELVKQYRQE